MFWKRKSATYAWVDKMQSKSTPQSMRRDSVKIPERRSQMQEVVTFFGKLDPLRGVEEGWLKREEGGEVFQRVTLAF